MTVRQFKEILGRAASVKSGYYVKVLAYLMSVEQTNEDGYIKITQVEIANALNIHRIQVVEAIKYLEENRYIRVKKKRNLNLYKIVY